MSSIDHCLTLSSLGLCMAFFMLYSYLFILEHKCICLCLHFSSEKVFILSYKTKNNIFKSQKEEARGKNGNRSEINTQIHAMKHQVLPARVTH